MIPFDQLSELINNEIKNFKYPHQPRGLYEPIEYFLEGSGKRLRPTLLLACAQGCGLNAKKAINQALGIEMYHNFTLLHDDVMDKADMRRSRPTVHIRWNECTAILSGDAMLTMASQLMAKDAGKHLAEVLEMFNRTAMEVYEGQQYDMDFEKRDDVSVEEYINMIRLKTSVLLAGACYIGAIMAGANKLTADALYRYGVNLGLAFQLVDDLLDTFGDPKTFGKEIGGDIANNKKTWLLINAMHMAPKKIEQYLKIDDRKEKIEKVRSLYKELGLDQSCQSLINDYIQRAIDAIPNSITRDAHAFLYDLALKNVSRQK